jgi:Phosphatidylserine decarboxylase
MCGEQRAGMNVAPGTWTLAGPVLVAGVGGSFVSPALGIGLVLLGLGIVWFHRDPDRTIPPAGVVSPADGTVSVIRTEQGSAGQERVRVGVFMNVSDVHVNRAPVGGEIEAVEHVPGGHWPAFTKDAERNERLHVDLDGTRVTLIAGTVARRIHPWVEKGETLTRGERIGHVSFGSRADVVLPPRFDPAQLEIEAGDSVRAGESVLATEPAG